MSSSKIRPSELSTNVSFRSVAIGLALVLLVVVLAMESQPFAWQATTSFSIPVSPSVESTIVTKEERLVLLVLWRGAAHWYSSGGHRSANSGFGRDGTVHVTLQYGDVDADLLFNPVSHTAVIQGRTYPVAGNTNVLLIDGVGSTRGGQLIKTLFLDQGDTNADLRRGEFGAAVSSLTRSGGFSAMRCFPE